MRRALMLSSFILVCVVIASCAGIRNREIVRSGVLRLGVSSQAFLDVWGSPDKIRTEAGAETMTANWTGFRQGFFKGRRTLEIWVYEKIGIELAFSGGSLAGWKTDKTVEELKAASKPD